MWSLGWWPHALSHGLDPLIQHQLWAPVGSNIARSTSIPTAALALTPITVLFGPVVSYNVMSIASPVLAAFTAYLLCRRITGRELPALVGGFLFGFGPYEFTQLVAHPNLSLVFLVPVIVHLALRRGAGEISRRGYLLALGVVLALQVGLSTEVLATSVALGLTLLLLARLLVQPAERRQVDRLIGESLGACLLAMLITSPFLYYALIKGGQPHESPLISFQYGLDLLNPFFPTHATWLGSAAFAPLAASFEGNNITEADGYLSLAILLAFTLWVARTPRRMLAWMLTLTVALSMLAALGSQLHVAGIQTIALPYRLIRSVPVVSLITPSRIVVYASLAIAIGVAAWLAERPWRSRAGSWRWALVALGLVMVFPNIGSGLWGQSPSNPEFFATNAYKHYLRKGESLVALPFAQNDNSMLWQAETGFYFRMPEGYLGHFAPPQFASQPIVGELGGNREAQPAALLAFLHDYHVAHIVIDQTAGVTSPYPGELARLGLHGSAIDGVLLYSVPSHLGRPAPVPESAGSFSSEG